MSDEADKNSADTDDTEAAPQPDAEPETVVVDSRTVSVDPAELAWSLDDEPNEPGHRDRQRSLGSANLATATRNSCPSLNTWQGHTPIRNSAW
jgi:hypothetical protein